MPIPPRLNTRTVSCFRRSVTALAAAFPCLLAGCQVASVDAPEDHASKAVPIDTLLRDGPVRHPGLPWVAFPDTAEGRAELQHYLGPEVTVLHRPNRAGALAKVCHRVIEAAKGFPAFDQAYTQDEARNGPLPVFIVKGIDSPMVQTLAYPGTRPTLRRLWGVIVPDEDTGILASEAKWADVCGHEITHLYMNDGRNTLNRRNLINLPLFLPSDGEVSTRPRPLSDIRSDLNVASFFDFEMLLALEPGMGCHSQWLFHYALISRNPKRRGEWLSGQPSVEHDAKAATYLRSATALAETIAERLQSRGSEGPPSLYAELERNLAVHACAFRDYLSTVEVSPAWRQWAMSLEFFALPSHNLAYREVLTGPGSMGVLFTRLTEVSAQMLVTLASANSHYSQEHRADLFGAVFARLAGYRPVRLSVPHGGCLEPSGGGGLGQLPVYRSYQSMSESADQSPRLLPTLKPQVHPRNCERNAIRDEVYGLVGSAALPRALELIGRQRASEGTEGFFSRNEWVQLNGLKTPRTK